VFIDESGLLMAPLVRRTWGLRGQTPVFLQRTRSHKKVSAIAALCVSPDKDSVRLYFRLHPGKSVNTDLILCFIKALERQLGEPAVLVWDRLTAHRAKTVKDYLRGNRRLDAFFLPPYAPELNPVEYLWSYMKINDLANFAAFELDTLARATRKSGRSLQRKEYLLRSFINHSPLSLRLK
jgi:transposase